MKTLIIYVFCDFQENVEFFLKNGLIYQENYHYLLVINNPAFDIELIRKYLSGTVRSLIRANIGHDFQGWNEGLFLDSRKRNIVLVPYQNSETPLYQNYERFIFLNSTVKGPYLPRYSGVNWIEAFTFMLGKNNIAISGISVNFVGYPLTECKVFMKKHYNANIKNYSHVQSMAFSLTKEALDYLISRKLFGFRKQFSKSKIELICSAEIAMSALLKERKYNMYSLIYSQGLIGPEEDRKEHDPWLPSYPYHSLFETIFIKTNRKIEFLEQKRYDENV